MPDEQTPRPEPGPDADVGELRTDIEQTRAELGETINALTDKMDVKAHVQRRVEHAKDAVEQQAHHVNQKANEHRRLLLAVVATGIAVIGIALYVRRR